MIDIQKAKQNLKQYVNHYDTEDKKIKMKIAHVERTANIARKIAENLNLDTEDIKLAELIGLLHDIGRFEQVKQYHTFVDKNSVNHGELGVQILLKEGRIRDFVEDKQYDEIIRKSILNHNRNKKDIEFSNEKEELHSKIIRDADKTDIIYMLTFEEKEVAWEKADLSEEIISDEIYREFMEDKQINYKERKTSADIVVSHFAYIYDFNYDYALQIIKENQYFEKIYHRFQFKNAETENRMSHIYERIQEELENIS